MKALSLFDWTPQVTPADVEAHLRHVGPCRFGDLMAEFVDTGRCDVPTLDAASAPFRSGEPGAYVYQVEQA